MAKQGLYLLWNGMIYLFASLVVKTTEGCGGCLAEEDTAESLGQVSLTSDIQKDGIRMQGLKLHSFWHLPLCAAY